MNVEKSKLTGLKLLICSISIGLAFQTAQVIGNCGDFCDDQIELVLQFHQPAPGAISSHCYKFDYRYENFTYTPDSTMTVRDPAFPETETPYKVFDQSQCVWKCLGPIIAVPGFSVKSTDAQQILPVLLKDSAPDFRCRHNNS